jgi:DNA primase
MILPQTVYDFLSEYGKIYIHGNRISMRCPICLDSKKSKIKRRFSMICEDGQAYYNCFNCGASGTLAELVSQLKGVSISEAIRTIETPDFDNIKCSLTKVEPEPVVVKERGILNYILDDCISKDTEVSGYIMTKYKILLNEFLVKRNIPSEYKVFIAYKGDYKNRIIIPIYYKNDILYFQGRALTNDVELKFMNPVVEKTGIIMNIDHFQRDMFIIVTEGIIDAMMIEHHQGTCVIGGSVSDDFLSSLYVLTDQGVIIAVDNDERGEVERKKLINNSKYGKQLYFYVTPKGIKDLNELKIKGHTHNMYDLIVKDKLDSFTYIIKNSF